MDVDEDSTFDLAEYAGNYRGHVKVARLVHIVEHATSASMRRSALLLALQELRQHSVNLGLYNSLTETARDLIGSDFQPDAQWVEQVAKESLQLQEQLEIDLQAAKTNSIREGMRHSLMDLGSFYYDRGDFFNASKMFLRTRDHCASPAQVLASSMAVVKTYVHTHNWPMVLTYFQKALGVVTGASPNETTQRAERGKLAAAAGLAEFASGRFVGAANHFAEVSAEMGDSFDDVVSPLDVARYGALSALAVHGRSAIKAKFLNNANFATYLEYAVEVREMLDAFCSSRFPEAFSILESLRPTLDLDLHATWHLKTLYAEIRSRVLQQYTAPYQSLRLADIARDLGSDVADTERELTDLIVAGKVPARIDSHNKVLYKQQRNERQVLLSGVLRAADEHIVTARTMLLRTELLRNRLRPSLHDPAGLGASRTYSSRSQLAGHGPWGKFGYAPGQSSTAGST